MDLYHSTSSSWLLKEPNRLVFHQYVKPPADQVYRDHKPLNDALAANPGSHVYCVFFFHDEATGLKNLELYNHVLLRVKSTRMSLTGFGYAKDDRDQEASSHVWYRATSTSPVALGTRWIHPYWGIPFSEIDIRENAQSSWVSLTEWVEAKQAAEQALIAPRYEADEIEAETYQNKAMPAWVTPEDEDMHAASSQKRYPIFSLLRRKVLSLLGQ